MDPSKENIEGLCQTAFNHQQPDSTEVRAALKSLANILLLHAEARQRFVDTGNDPAVADRLQNHSDDPETELVCSRILFLLTYGTNADFDILFDNHSLARSINRNVKSHRSDAVHTISDKAALQARALDESLKLLFNLTRFYPKRVSEFDLLVPEILALLHQLKLPSPTLQSPVTLLTNALLNLNLTSEQSDDAGGTSPLFPDDAPEKHTRLLISILAAGLESEKNTEKLEVSATPLVSVLRRVNEIAPSSVRKIMQELLLPTSEDRAQPLGRSDSLASCLLRLSNTPSATNLREAVSGLLFELSDHDALTFVRNVGYGYAAGFLMAHRIAIPAGSSEADLPGSEVDGQHVNPITGQRVDMEPVDTGPEMTDEEKEREAERLFVLFERLRATGVMNVVNPVREAQQSGRLEEVD